MELREYLFKKNITQIAFARMIDYDIAYIRSVYHKRKKPGKKLIKAIVKATEGEVTEKDLM